MFLVEVRDLILHSKRHCDILSSKKTDDNHCCLTLMPVAVINAMTKTQLRRGKGLFQFRNESTSSVRARAQEGNFETGTKIEIIEEFC